MTIDEDPRRVALRLHPDTYERVSYWADRKGVSRNEWMADAIEGAIDRVNNNYDLPTLELQRTNQLIDLVQSLSANVASLEVTVRAMANSLIGLAKGDSYLFDDDTGDLPVGE